jgi:hypothetical protein
MLLVCGIHGVCFIALLVRRPWSRHLAATIALGWALLLGWQLTEAFISTMRTSITELLLAAGLLVALLSLAVAFFWSRAVKAYLGSQNAA